MPKGIAKNGVNRGWFKKDHKVNNGRPSLLKGRNGKPASEERKKKVSQSMKGHIVTEETRLKISKSKMGIKPSPETLIKLSISHLKADCKSPDNQRFYWSARWIKLRNSIYKRDNYTCRECGKRCSTQKNANRIICHHIDYNINNNSKSNLITLCASCHTKTNYTREDWIKRFKDIV